mmetsp:Transcript_863/g.738  ORF Transcript_863/g.738 Transcript_863/m.738 type:complete len:165 (+) Transcript_863:190-684(+)
MKIMKKPYKKPLKGKKKRKKRKIGMKKIRKIPQQKIPNFKNEEELHSAFHKNIKSSSRFNAFESDRQLESSSIRLNSTKKYTNFEEIDAKTHFKFSRKDKKFPRFGDLHDIASETIKDGQSSKSSNRLRDSKKNPNLTDQNISSKRVFFKQGNDIERMKNIRKI